VFTQIEHQVGEPHLIIVLVEPSRPSAYSCEQHLKRKWFGQIIVGACVEPAHNFFGSITGGKQKDRRQDFLPAEVARDLQAIHEAS
jgi:hypothetical protein